MRRLVARDVMNPEVLSVRADMSVMALAAFLIDNEISGAPVEDENGRLVGVVSLTDIAVATSDVDDRDSERDAATSARHRGEPGRPGFYAHGWEDKLAAEELAGFDLAGEELTVRDIMTPAVFAVDLDTPVPKVAETMLANHVHRLLVTRGDQVAGIITSSDLLGLLVEES